MYEYNVGAVCSESVPGAPHRAERGRHRQGVCEDGDHAQEGASRGAALRPGDLLGPLMVA